MVSATIASTELSGLKALKVRVNVTANDHFSGTHCAGRFWDEGVNEAILEGDPEATGEPVPDEHTGGIRPIYTLEGKLSQLYTLEGRARLAESPRQGNWKRWSDPGFPLPDTSGKDPDKQSKPHRAKRLIKLEIIDRQLSSGKWESETPEAEHAPVGSKPTAPSADKAKK
jgi:hypothetical protein